MSVQKTILVVDNEEQRRKSISILLATSGYQLIVANLIFERDITTPAFLLWE